jgi:PKD repeat protein
MKHILRTAFVLALALGAIALPSAAIAAPPLNDDFANAAIINPAALPFTDSEDITAAAYEAGESGSCGVSNTVWYSFTPAQDGIVRADPSGSTFYGAVINAYRQDGSGLGGLSLLACSPYFGNPVTFSVQAGDTYYLQAGSSYWGAGELHLKFDVVPPPANDDFADANAISALPFSDTVDAIAGGNESDEPSQLCAGNAAGSVWYRFTPSQSGSVSAQSPYGSLATVLAAYSGSSLGNLTELGCRTYGSLLTMHVDAGSTYYFQVGGLYGQKGTLQFNLNVAPDPTANFNYYPSDPSTFDNVQFNDYSYDPGQAGFKSWNWDFGDGGSSTAQSPTHKFPSDGDYKVKLTVTTTDGRTASTTQTIQVRTHDVAIAKLLVPQTATAGQTRTITIGISNRRYAETVEVDLFKSTPQGFVFAGSLTQSVPVRPAGRTTDFKINYTFTSDDAALGKVTFKAVATIIGHRDALPADNEAVALPTKVTG